MLQCDRCPRGATCNSTATTVETLIVKVGHFRLSDTSADVRRCPDHNMADDGSESGIALLTRPSGCLGGTGGGEVLCRDRLGGIYCQACSAELDGRGFYYDSAARECLRCSKTLPTGVVFVLGFFAIVVVLYLLGVFARGWLRW